MLAKKAFEKEENLREYREALSLVFKDNRVQRNLEAEGWGCVSAEKAYIYSVKGTKFLLDLENVALEYSCLCAERFGISYNCEIFSEMLQRNSDLVSSFVAKTIFYGCRSNIKLTAGVIKEAQRFIATYEDFFSIADGSELQKFLSKKCFA